ncbi:MAG: 4-(cytidine 5'-diphospho)-2-C-methyl-D-erythritol kinase [Acidobacteriaceae bacterium]|nr:4-(cytidine 5'-diphospho)-2-C-methyl-D-erythritol kinase [Acidobacteriaceae bacterium]
MNVTVPCFAKLNLDLRVLYKRDDGYHELRTIFQTINLKDRLHIEFRPDRKTHIEVSSSVYIPDNLVVRSAKLLLDYLKVSGWVRFALSKIIPLGAGLGGGSSNAAAVLLALPALIGKKIPYPDLVRLAESLGSDVPFFLQGGTALGLGRGTELYPLPDQPPRHAVVVVAPGIHVSTPEAYRSLGRSLTSPSVSPILREFQAITWNLDRPGLDTLPLTNDFQLPVLRAHPSLANLARKLQRLGARPALMTGSGSALFGIFPSAEAAERAAADFPALMAFPVRFVSRRQYARAWRHALGSAAEGSCFANRRSGRKG